MRSEVCSLSAAGCPTHRVFCDEWVSAPSRGREFMLATVESVRNELSSNCRHDPRGYHPTAAPTHSRTFLMSGFRRHRDVARLQSQPKLWAYSGRVPKACVAIRGRGISTSLPTVAIVASLSWEPSSAATLSCKRGLASFEARKSCIMGLSRCDAVRFRGGPACGAKTGGEWFLAIRLQSVCRPSTAFHVLLCHPWPCMLLNLRFQADSIPSALTKPNIHAGFGALAIDPYNKSRNKPRNGSVSIRRANNNFHSPILK